MASGCPKGSSNNAGGGGNPQMRARPRAPPSPRPCAPPGVTVRPARPREESPPRPCPGRGRQQFRPPQQQFPTQYRPVSNRPPPPQNMGGSPCMGGTNDLDLMTSNEMQSFDCSGGGGVSGLYSSDDGRYSPYSSGMTSGMQSSYYNSTMGSPANRTRTTTSTTIITTEEEDDDDEDEDEDEDFSGGGGAANATYTRGNGTGGAGGRTFTFPSPGQGGGGGGAGGGGYNPNATYARPASPCGARTDYVSDFSDFADYDSTGYFTSGTPELYSSSGGGGGMDGTYDVAPARAQSPLRGPIPGPGCPGGSGGAGGAGGGGPGGAGGHNKTFTKIIKKVITESPSEPGGSGGQGRSGSPGGQGGQGPCGGNQSSSSMNQSDFARGIRPGGQSTPKRGQGSPGGAGGGYGGGAGGPGGGCGPSGYGGAGGSGGGGGYGGAGGAGGSCGQGGGGGAGGGYGSPGGGYGGAGGGCSPGGAGGRGGQGQGIPNQDSQGGLSNEVQRHLDELECTERTQINCDLAMFQQARRRLVEVTTTISTTQPPVSFSGCPPGR